jgi:hypothetical protein
VPEPGLLGLLLLGLGALGMHHRLLARQRQLQRIAH